MEAKVQAGQPESIRGLLKHAQFASEIAHAYQPPGAVRLDVNYSDDVVRQRQPRRLA